jgi:hypothetical protein
MVSCAFFDYRIASVAIFWGALASLDSGIIGCFFPCFSTDARPLNRNMWAATTWSHLENTLKDLNKLNPYRRIITSHKTTKSPRFVASSIPLLPPLFLRTSDRVLAPETNFKIELLMSKQALPKHGSL